MAASQGYQCEFIDSVFDDFYCKKCTLVARRLTVTTCCGESFCHACIADNQEEGKPCLECGKTDFTSFEQVKNQKRINCLRVYCSMKERGCDWSGTLEQLDTHLDPDQDNCQYVDTKCPLNCHMTIPKNKVEQHVAQHCAKRPYVCQHCNFKATYEEVMDTHLPECKYVPLQCPNLCGVTFERDFMEDHMKMCRLQEVGCEFSGVGCDGRFIREDQEEHTRQNSQKHLTLTASLAVETKEQLQQKLLEQDKKQKEEEEKIEEQEKKRQRQEEKLGEQEKMLEEQEKKLGEQKDKLNGQEKKLEEEEKKWQQQERKLGEQEKKQDEQKKKLVQQEKKLEEEEKKRQQQERKLGEQEKKLDDQNKKLKEQEKKLIDQENKQKREEQKLKQKIEELNIVQQQKLDEHKQLLQQQFNSKLKKLEQMLKEVADKSIQNEGKLSMMSSTIYLNRRFEMKNFSHEKAKDQHSDWKSPAMYTHVGGYKFCIGVDANGCGDGHGKSVYVDLWPTPGEYDDKLKWPAKVKFTVELINQKGGENASHSKTETWTQPTSKYEDMYGFVRIFCGFIEHSKLCNFLNNNTLYFLVSEVKLL